VATANLNICFIDYNLFIILFFSFIPVYIWIKFVLYEDTHKEPFSFIVLAIFLGILAAVLSYISEERLSHIFNTNTLEYLFFSAFIEEFFKFFLVFLFIVPTKNFHYLIDSMIYLGLAGIGFSFLENAASKCSILVSSSPDSAYISIAIISLTRFLSANFLHLLTSTLIGFGYSITLKTRRIFPFIFSFIMASILHFIYNSFIIKELIVYVFPILWAIFFVVLEEFQILKKLDGRIRTFSSN
jgi:RsiW-degrading membrane proteinase PrsW (M82 family)